MLLFGVSRRHWAVGLVLGIKECVLAVLGCGRVFGQQIHGHYVEGFFECIGLFSRDLGKWT